MTAQNLRIQNTHLLDKMERCSRIISSKITSHEQLVVCKWKECVSSNADELKNVNKA